MWYLEKPVISLISGVLYLGNQLAAQDETILRAHKIKRIISVVEQPSRMPSKALCEKLNLWHGNFRISDDEFEDEADELTTNIFPWIADSEKNHQPILIHCHASVSRSPSLVIAYLIWCGSSFDDALTLVAREHPPAAPKPGVLRSFLACINCVLPGYYHPDWHAERLMFHRKYDRDVSR